ncbi:hypothetical protein MHK_001049 [Candidatus Magnetomorum sp. HK-1]|nr:hypothetical protein MHK_001049 [Candidatus Magnetomorum sp. HK-1]
MSRNNCLIRYCANFRSLENGRLLMSRNFVKIISNSSSIPFGKWPAFDVTEQEIESSPEVFFCLENGRLLMSRNLLPEDRSYHHYCLENGRLLMSRNWGIQTNLRISSLENGRLLMSRNHLLHSHPTQKRVWKMAGF